MSALSHLFVAVARLDQSRVLMQNVTTGEEVKLDENEIDLLKSQWAGYTTHDLDDIKSTLWKHEGGVKTVLTGLVQRKESLLSHEDVKQISTDTDNIYTIAQQNQFNLAGLLLNS